MKKLLLLVGLVVFLTPMVVSAEEKENYINCTCNKIEYQIALNSSWFDDVPCGVEMHYWKTEKLQGSFFKFGGSLVQLSALKLIQPREIIVHIQDLDSNFYKWKSIYRKKINDEFHFQLYKVKLNRIDLSLELERKLTWKNESSYEDAELENGLGTRIFYQCKLVDKALE